MWCRLLSKRSLGILAADFFESETYVFCNPSEVIELDDRYLGQLSFANKRESMHKAAFYLATVNGCIV